MEKTVLFHLRVNKEVKSELWEVKAVQTSHT